MAELRVVPLLWLAVLRVATAAVLELKGQASTIEMNGASLSASLVPRLGECRGQAHRR